MSNGYVMYKFINSILIPIFLAWLIESLNYISFWCFLISESTLISLTFLCVKGSTLISVDLLVLWWVIAHAISLTILYLFYILCTYVFNSFSRKLQHVSNSKYLIIMCTLHLITARNYERDFTSSQY